MLGQEGRDMYAVIRFEAEGYDKVMPVLNPDGSLRIFSPLTEADQYANSQPDSDDLRVISLDGVRS
jgi:hypothetical protein